MESSITNKNIKTQVVIIHGGDTFNSDREYQNFLKNFEIDIERYKQDKTDWKPWLRKALGKKYEVILPKMPNSNNAKYKEWKLWFEKLIPFLNNEVILVGHSLGASFLVKYLSQSAFHKKVKGLFLVGAVYDKDDDGYDLASFKLPEKLNLRTENSFFYHSKNDPVVPFSQLQLFLNKIPEAKSRIFENRKHFNQDKFPELIKDIKSL